MSLTRVKHWDTVALHAFLLERVHQPFEWGKNDCALFAADAVLAMTGTDIAAEFRGKYTDEASAFALIKTVTGGTTVADAAVYCAKQHALPEWDAPRRAQRGDLVVIENGGRLIAGVVHLNGRSVATMSERGVVLLSILNVIRSWHV